MCVPRGKIGEKDLLPQYPDGEMASAGLPTVYVTLLGMRGAGWALVVVFWWLVDGRQSLNPHAVCGQHS